MTVDLTVAPFHLDDAAVTWVSATIDSMSIEEKIGQLFISMNGSFEPAYLDSVVDRFHPGGMRFPRAHSSAIQQHIRHVQSRSRVPVLFASNPEMGGFGSAIDGTLVATHLQAGSHPDADIAFELGRIAGVESAALGCNWAFAPVVDIHYNWRNTVIANRAFGNTPDVVIERAKRFFDGLAESNVAAAIKHFPGDGVDERDQHVVTTYNSMPADEWRATYGRVYRELIAHGVQSVMVGHIGAPELSRELRPGIADRDIMPATLAPELLHDLLRGELGFNGVVLTDSSIMVGMTQAMNRADLLPAAIAAGCDMVLFFRSPEEDFEYVLEGYRSGVISPERLDDALRRILGLKASLGLHLVPADQLVPSPDTLSVVGSDEHRAIAARIADKTVTLVKDAGALLPITPVTHPRIRLYGVAGDEDFTGSDPNAYLDVAREELERAGFEVHVFTPDLAEPFHVRMKKEANAGYSDRYDAAILFANVSGFAQQTAIRIRWSTPLAIEIPWYVAEVPTVFVSLNQPNHLADVAMVGTVIHAHNASREAIRAAVEKITGASEFHGTFNENVWCGDTWGTRR